VNGHVQRRSGERRQIPGIGNLNLEPTREFPPDGEFQKLALSPRPAPFHPLTDHRSTRHASASRPSRDHFRPSQFRLLNSGSWLRCLKIYFLKKRSQTMPVFIGFLKKQSQIEPKLSPNKPTETQKTTGTNPNEPKTLNPEL
jgi:hypothetical protein